MFSGRMLVILFLLLTDHFTFAQPSLQVIYPKQNEPVFALDSIFVIGNVQPPQTTLQINNLPVKIYPNGAFVKMLAIVPPSMSLDFIAALNTDTIRYKQQVWVPDYLMTSPLEPMVLDTSFAYPQENMVLRAGDWLRVAIKGSPEQTVYFAIDSVVVNQPMPELATEQQHFWGYATIGGIIPRKPRGVSGVYSGVYRITGTERVNDASIRVYMINSRQDIISAVVPGKVSIDSSKTPDWVKLPLALPEPIERNYIGARYLFPPGATLGITGHYGAYARLQLSDREAIWAKLGNNLQLKKAKNPIANSIRSIRLSKNVNRTQVSVRMNQTVPVKIQQKNDPASFTITFYGIEQLNPQLFNMRQFPDIKEIRWLNPSEPDPILYVELNMKQMWGYAPVFYNNQFILEIKNPPQIAVEPVSAIKDLVITLDPGHNPDLGAVGPTGLSESEANLMVCHRIRDALEEKGALVVLTRDDDEGVALTTRPKLASFVDSDVLISVHFNSLPDGANPLRNHGTSTYYYQPMSYQLAYTIHQNLLKQLKLPDFGLFYRSFVMTRPTDMLSVLIEPAFIVNPEEEMAIRTLEFQNKIARAITDALEAYFSEFRPKQQENSR